MKGFGSGLIWGGVIGALGLVVASENAPLPGRPVQPVTEVVKPVEPTEAAPPTTPEPAEPTVAPEPAAPEPTASPDAAGQSEPDALEASTATPQAVTPVPEPPAPEAEPPKAPDPKPTAEPAAPEAQAPDATTPDATVPAASGDAADTNTENSVPTAEVADAVDVPAGSEFARTAPETEPVLPDAATAPATSDAPAAPAPDQGQFLPATDTTTAAAPEPDPAGPLAPELPEADESAPEIANPVVAPSEPSLAAVPDTPSPEAAPSAADLPPPPPLTPEEEALADSAPGQTPQPEPVPLPDLAVLPSDPPLTPVAPLPGEEVAAGAPPETGFAGQVDGVVTGRLPRIGDAPAEAEDAGLAVDPADLPPIDRFAREFLNPDGKPAFAIILIDRGDPDLDRARLAALPFPVTFALDPTLPDVDQLAAPYLEAGQEVAMLATGIPEGATAADLEVTFAAHADALPEAVAVVDLPDGGFQGNRPLATLVVPILKGQGRGLLTYDGGLNAADQVASRDQLRAGTIFRRIDPEGEPVTAIRRVLDRAAFKAAQVGRVAVIGEARPETVAALLEWTVEGKASAVALAPATAVLVAR